MVAVAYSGGRDSTAALHAVLRAARPLGVAVVAAHVNHGLSDQADAWETHCARQCKRWAASGWTLQYSVERITDAPPPAASVEAWARARRYAALAKMARAVGAVAVVLAQHRRDQAETFVLQVLRGGGLERLAAMPRSAHRDGLLWLRPWLDVASGDIDAYVRRHRLAFVEDESNTSLRFARSRLRQSVWPSLLAAFPDAELAIAASTQRLQDALQASREWLSLDLAQIVDADGRLGLARWKDLPDGRRRAVLRAWLRERLGQGAPAALSARLLDEAGRGNGRHWQAPGGEVHERSGRLVFRGAGV